MEERKLFKINNLVSNSVDTGPSVHDVEFVGIRPTLLATVLTLGLASIM